MVIYIYTSEYLYVNYLNHMTSHIKSVTPLYYIYIVLYLYIYITLIYNIYIYNKYCVHKLSIVINLKNSINGSKRAVTRHIKILM